ncbi:MAG: sodium:proline symporter, partial [Pseudomonadota bacterium]
MTLAFAAALIAIGLATLALAPRTREAQGFFYGTSANGQAPTMWTLALSQVTTWIFARSLMNAAILGYFFGYAGVLAYAAYYLSFFTGAVIVDQIRFRHGYASVQDFLAARFGRVGVGCYNLTIGVRLLSEVFANLLVVGLLFGAAGDGDWTIAIIVAALVTLAYSMMGGLRASLRTDV